MESASQANTAVLQTTSAHSLASTCAGIELCRRMVSKLHHSSLIRVCLLTRLSRDDDSFFLATRIQKIAKAKLGQVLQKLCMLGNRSAGAATVASYRCGQASWCCKICMSDMGTGQLVLQELHPTDVDSAVGAARYACRTWEQVSCCCKKPCQRSKQVSCCSKKCMLQVGTVL